jgi:uncharacterized tellurite resistance protein B-like protein
VHPHDARPEARVLDAIRRFFDQQLAAPRDGGDERHRLALATAALLVEVMRLDGVADDERAAVLRAVTAKFGLADDEAAELVTLAEAEVREAVGFYQFTSLINRHFDVAQKERVVELMWRVAWADDAVSAHELHVIRKIADLLHLPHASYVAAKQRARGVDTGGDAPLGDAVPG